MKIWTIRPRSEKLNYTPKGVPIVEVLPVERQNNWNMLLTTFVIATNIKSFF